MSSQQNLRGRGRTRPQPVRRTRPSLDATARAKILRGSSLRSMAARISISPSYLHLILTGKRRASATVLLRMSRVISIPAESLHEMLSAAPAPEAGKRKRGKAGR